MTRLYTCNLHVHTCLSPCGDLDMHPSAIVEEATLQNMDIIAVCDHNTAENVRYVARAAENTSLSVIPGMEVTTREEVHVLAFFERVEQLDTLQAYVYEHLNGLNNEKAFGMQVIVNEIGEVEGFNERLLIGATEISLEDLVERVHEYGGLAVAAHIDRPSFSVLSQLGFVPAHVPFDALEISARLSLAEARHKFPELEKYTFITSSDAHFIEDLGKTCIRMNLKEPSFSEIRLALQNKDGRYVLE
ncbi:MAG: PHP domain-containing protein [Deltaproteobacteria bacterium]|nr:PHP domain-containing protein [Deltaproteobacteria bacterium]